MNLDSVPLGIVNHSIKIAASVNSLLLSFLKKDSKTLNK